MWISRRVATRVVGQKKKRQKVAPRKTSYYRYITISTLIGIKSITIITELVAHLQEVCFFACEVKASWMRYAFPHRLTYLPTKVPYVRDRAAPCRA